MMNDNTFPIFRTIAQNLRVWNPDGIRMTPYPTVTLTTGATIRFRSADDPEKLRGPNLSGVWLDEASLMPHDAYLIVIASLREGGQQGWLSATFTPRGFGHWTFEQFGKNVPNTAIVHCSTDANQFLPDNFRKQLEEQYGKRGLLAQQELGGEFVTVEGAEWGAEYFSDDLWFDDFPTNFVASVMSLDPSKGKDTKTPKTGKEPDYSVYIMARLDNKGIVWIDADVNNVRDATRMVLDGIGLYRQFKPMAIVIEINQFQELLGPEFFRVSKELNIDHLPLYGINNYTNKEIRIRTIGPFLAKRELRFRNTPGAKMLVQQLRDFPAGAYDDAPDALEMALKMLIFLVTGTAEGAQPRLLRA